MRTFWHTGIFAAVVVLGLGCGGTLETGIAKKPVNDKPAADGTCPSGQSVCGTGRFVICADLQNDPGHCGACDRTCSPGIACQAGICQQTVCAGAAMPFSGQPTTSAPNPGSVVVSPRQLLADVNGDGLLDRVDWIAGAFGPSEVLSVFRVSLGQPGGGFGPPDTYQASAAVLQVYVVDVNADGSDDLFVFAQTFANAAVSPGRVELWLGNSDGRLTRSERAGMSGPMLSGFAPVIADLSGDGWPDLVMQAPQTDYPAKSSVYLSDSTGALHFSASYVTGTEYLTYVRDWNGDGSPDLAFAGNGLQMLYNRGDGTFEQPVSCGVDMRTAGWSNTVIDDFNKDGRPDVVKGSFSVGSIGVMLGLGGCGFSPISYYDIPGGNEGFLRAVDMNGDGQLDLVSVSPVYALNPDGVSHTVVDYLLTVLLGRPDGTFQPQDTAVSLGPDVTDVAVGEVSGDGRPDVIVSSSDGQARPWENTCQ